MLTNLCSFSFDLAAGFQFILLACAWLRPLYAMTPTPLNPRFISGAASDSYNIFFNHRLNMELDLQSLFGLMCTTVLID
jgi:hypothetical protein